MAEFFVGLELHNNRAAASSGLRTGHVEHTTTGGLTFAGSLGPIVEPMIPRSAHTNTETGGTTNGIARVMAGVSGATTTGALVAHRVDTRATWQGPLLASPSQVITQHSDISWGRQSPRYRLATGGALDAAIDADIGAPDANSFVHAEWSYPQANPYTGMLHVGEFADDDDGDERSNIPVALQRVFNDIHKRGGYSYPLGVTSGGQAIVADDCDYAGLAPEGRVYITAADLGTDAEDIPPAVTQNTAARFRFHPSVFVRRGSYVSGLSYRHHDNNPLVTGGLGSQPIGVIVIDQPQPQSRWLCSLDGEVVLLAFAHPAGSDYRRPRDIWNNVIVPAIRGATGANVVTTLPFGDVVSNTPNVHSQIYSRLRYLEYARFIGASGTGITQTGTQPA